MKRDPNHITAWQRLTENITTSGKIGPENVAELAELGVRCVINLAPDSSPGALPNEGALVSESGMAYIHIPIPFGEPKQEHFEAFVSAFKSQPGPIHVHCIANWRVSACFYRYHRDHLGMPEDRARAILEQQWVPETSEYPGAQAWAEFIAPKS